MKVANQLAVLLGLGMIAPFVSAKSLDQTYLDTCAKGPGIPVPVAVVSPTVSVPAGESARIEFTVDTAGKASAIRVLSSSDSTLSDAMVDAVKQWQFKPAMKNGQPVTTKVVLPVRVVSASVIGYASE